MDDILYLIGWNPLRIILDSKNPKISDDELREASRFYYRILVNPDDYKRTTIRIVSLPFLKRGYHGITAPNKKGKPHYTIYLNTKYGYHKQLCSLAHELVHVKPFVTGELGPTWKECGETFTRWMSKDISETNTYYHDLPWEIEARGREYGLYRRYQMYRKQKRVGERPQPVLT